MSIATKTSFINREKTPLITHDIVLQKEFLNLKKKASNKASKIWDGTITQTQGQRREIGQKLIIGDEIFAKWTASIPDFSTFV